MDSSKPPDPSTNPTQNPSSTGGPTPAERLEADLFALSEAVRSVRRGLLLVITGAGISAPSGLATFRGPEPEAVWKQSDVEIATAAFFHRDPLAHWRWYRQRFERLAGAEPNPAHHALAALETWQRGRGDFLLVTQNIDTLHEAAGSERLIKIHGTSDRLRCSRDACPKGAPHGSVSMEEVGFDPFAPVAEGEPSRETLPRCPDCKALLRPHVLFFDEVYDGHSDYRFAEVQRAFERVALMLFVGTSFSVGITDMALRTALFTRTPTWSIDPAAHAGEEYPFLRRIEAGGEVVLPALCERLGVEELSPSTPDGD